MRANICRVVLITSSTTSSRQRCYCLCHVQQGVNNDLLFVNPTLFPYFFSLHPRYVQGDIPLSHDLHAFVYIPSWYTYSDPLPLPLYLSDTFLPLPPFFFRRRLVYFGPFADVYAKLKGRERGRINEVF